MKKILLMIFAFLILPLAVISQSNQAACAFDGYDVRGDYKADIVYGDFSLSNGRVLSTFSVTFDKVFFESIKNNGNVFNDESLIDFLEGFISSEMGYEVQKDDNGRVVGSKIYDSVTDRYIAAGRDGYEKNDNDYDSESTFWFTTITSKWAIFEDAKNSNNVLNFIMEILTAFGLQKEEIALSFHYGTPYKVIESDAEKVYFDTNYNIYVHEFYMDINTCDRQLVMRQTVPNTVNWYLVAILSAIPFVVAPILIGLRLKKKERKRSM